MGVRRINRATAKLVLADVQDSEPTQAPEAPEQSARAPVKTPEGETKVSSPPTSSGKRKDK